MFIVSALWENLEKRSLFKPTEKLSCEHIWFPGLSLLVQYEELHDYLTQACNVHLISKWETLTHNNTEKTWGLDELRPTSKSPEWC